MKNSKKKIIENIILSKGNIHFTLYVRPEYGLSHMKKQIVTAIMKTNEELKDILTKEELRDFLKPIWRMYSDENMLKKFKLPIGIFRNREDFHVLAIPVKHDSDFSLADSYFVKPLLKWMQFDHEYILVGVNNRSASLMYGDLTEAHVVDEIYYDENSVFKNESSFVDEISFWISEWKQTMGASPRTSLIILGAEPWVDKLSRKYEKKKGGVRLLRMNFEKEHRSLYLDEIRKIFAHEATLSLKTQIREFHFHTNNEEIITDIFEIAEAVSSGRVKKIMINEDFKIYGKYNVKDGTLNIHNRDMDYEDDDLLDDIAQEVIKQKGEVIVVSKNANDISAPIKAIVRKENFAEKQI